MNRQHLPLYAITAATLIVGLVAPACPPPLSASPAATTPTGAA